MQRADARADAARLRVGSGTRTRTVAARLLGALVSFATALVILAAALGALLLPVWMHPALDLAGSPAILGMSASDARSLSDATVHELVFGPGDFAVRGPDGRPFYDPAEVSHLRDARTVLLVFLALAGASAAVLAWRLRVRRRAAWRSVARGAAGLGVALVVIGLFAALAFPIAFELFHRVFFPGGNWAFDPSTQRLVQLYPYAFWQLTAGALGTIALLLSVVVWLVARRVAASAVRESGDEPRRREAV